VLNQFWGVSFLESLEVVVDLVGFMFAFTVIVMVSFSLSLSLSF